MDTTVGEQRAIESGAVGAMAPTTAAGLLAELERRNRVFGWHVLYFLLLTAAAFLAFALKGPVLAGALLAAALVGTIPLAIWTNRRRAFRIEYHLDADYGRLYSAVLSAFERLRNAQRFWLVESEADVHDRKYHAGASKTLRRTPARAVCVLPARLKCNVTPPMIPAGRQRLYLLPDRILVYDGAQVGAVEYAELQLDAATTRFIEEESAPSDAPRVDSTWKYVNKKGGPDRRFSDNRQLPIMHYGELRWFSASGLNERHQVSSPEAAAAFAQAVSALAAGLIAAPTSRGIQAGGDRSEAECQRPN